MYAMKINGCICLFFRLNYESRMYLRSLQVMLSSLFVKLSVFYHLDCELRSLIRE